MRRHWYIALITLLLTMQGIYGQVPLIPDWVHTEAHGSGQNGRLAIDSVSGLVYWTLSEDNSSITIPQAEIHVFDQVGNDLTPASPAFLAIYNSSTDMLRESVEDPYMEDDTMLVGIYDHVLQGMDRSTLAEWTANSQQRTITIFGENDPSRIIDIWSDDSGMIMLMDQSARYVLSFDRTWLPTWQYSTSNNEHALAASNNKIFLAHLPEVSVFDRMNGDLLSQFNVDNTALADAGVITVANGSLYHAYAVDSTIYVGRTDLLGNDIWDNSIYLGDDFIANEIIIDDIGGVWVSASLDTDINLDHVDGGRLVSVDPTGTFSQYYSYGSTMTDIAYANGSIFACGKLDPAATTSYLVAAQLGIPTSVTLANERNDALLIYPQPARNFVNVQWATAHNANIKLRVYDAFGREVSVSVGVMQNGLCRIELGGVSAGVYIVEARDEMGQVCSKPLIVR